MFEVLSWSYRFAYLTFMTLFVLISTLIVFKKKQHYNIFLPVLIIIISTSAFLLLAYYSEPIDLKPLFIAGISIITYLIARAMSSLLFKIKDFLIFDTISLLSLVGLCILYRLSADYGVRQLWFTILGYLSFIIINVILKKVNIKSYNYQMLGAIIFLTLVITQIIGIEVYGSKNWIKILGFSFQPSEFLKIVFVLYLASLLQLKLNTKNFILILSSIIVVVFFFALQTDLGSAFIFFLVYLIMLASKDEKMYFSIISGTTAVICAFISITIFSHIKSRVQAWINPWKYTAGKAYQIAQSLFAIASGGLFGTGLYLGDPKFIPAVHTDFIFSAICEETGIIGGIIIILLYMQLIYTCMSLCVKCKDNINSLIVLGLTSMTSIQTLIIICGVLNIVPITGVTLPFISYGGSSILSQFLNVGIIYYIKLKEEGLQNA